MDQDDQPDCDRPRDSLPAIHVIRRIADMADALACGPTARPGPSKRQKRRPRVRLTKLGHVQGLTPGPSAPDREARVLAHQARVQAELAALGEDDHAS